MTTNESRRKLTEEERVIKEIDFIAQGEKDREKDILFLVEYCLDIPCQLFVKK